MMLCSIPSPHADLAWPVSQGLGRRRPCPLQVAAGGACVGWRSHMLTRTLPLWDSFPRLWGTKRQVWGRVPMSLAPLSQHCARALRCRALVGSGHESQGRRNVPGCVCHGHTYMPTRSGSSAEELQVKIAAGLHVSVCCYLGASLVVMGGGLSILATRPWAGHGLLFYPVWTPLFWRGVGEVSGGLLGTATWTMQCIHPVVLYPSLSLCLF